MMPKGQDCQQHSALSKRVFQLPNQLSRGKNVEK